MPAARSTTASATVLVAIAAALLVGCAPTSPAEGGADPGTDGGGSGGEAAAGPNCDGVTTGGWEIFVDPRLTVDPSSEIVSLQDEGDVLAFTDTAPVGYTTYGYELGYIDDAGTVFPNDAAIFVGAENTQQFQLEGPFAPSGVDGGPYAGIIQIDATNDEGITTIARVCVLLATEE